MRLSNSKKNFEPQQEGANRKHAQIEGPHSNYIQWFIGRSLQKYYLDFHSFCNTSSPSLATQRCSDTKRKLKFEFFSVFDFSSFVEFISNYKSVGPLNVLFSMMGWATFMLLVQLLSRFLSFLREISFFVPEYDTKDITSFIGSTNLAATFVLIICSAILVKKSARFKLRKQILVGNFASLYYATV